MAAEDAAPRKDQHKDEDMDEGRKESTLDLTGKVAIVTGGGRGLGRAISLGLASAGADVALCGRKVESCKEAAAEIRARGRRALPLSCHMGPTIGLYCPSKAALQSLTRVMAQEWAPLGVRVNALAPGPVATDMVRAVEGTDFHRQMVESTAQKRIASPEEIVGSVLYLVSDASLYTTGSRLVVDGGSNN